LATPTPLTFFREARTTRAFLLTGLAAGLALVVAGLRVMQEPRLLVRYAPYLSLCETWNRTFRLQIPNLPNFLIGWLMLLVGVVIALAALGPGGWVANSPALRLPDLSPLRWPDVLPRLLGGLALFAGVLLQLGSHGYSVVGLVFWLISLLLLTHVLWKRERDASGDLSLHLARRDVASMLLLFALGTAIGAYRLTDVPAWVAGDEGAFWGTARSIATGEFDPVLFDFGVYSFPVASSMLQALVLRLVGMDLWAWRFASVLVACMTIFPLYLLGREVFDRRVATVACIVMVSNPYFLAFARLGYNNSQAVLSVALTAFLLVLGLKRGSYFYLWLAGLAAGFGYYTYISAWLGFVLIVIVSLALPLASHVPFRKALPLLLVPLAGWIAVALPRIVYNVSGPVVASTYFKVLETSIISGFYGRVMFGDAIIDQALTWSPGDAEIFFGLPQYGILVVRGFVRAVAAWLAPLNEGQHFLTAELAGPGSSTFFAVGVGIALVGLRKTGRWLLNTWFWIGLICLGVLTAFPPRPSHTVSMIPAVALIVALGMVAVVEAVMNLISPFAVRRPGWATAAVAVLLLMVAGMGSRAYFVGVPVTYAPDYDHRASWIIHHTPASAKVWFVDQVPTPHDAQYQADVHLVERKIQVASRRDLPAVAADVRGGDFVVFVADDGSAARVAAELGRLLPQATLQPILRPDRTPLGLVVSNLHLPMAPSARLSDGLRDLGASPAGALILACVAAALILVAQGWRPRSAANEAGSSSGPRGFGRRIRRPIIDIDFRVRFQFPPPPRRQVDDVEESHKGDP
jgi:4-amino-4-deoxy-L-arabinose transferase-like glycosyltransferase